jgi:2-phosphosulfolactate phosphatase
VLWTTNGARAFGRVAASPAVVAAALTNRTAAIERTLGEAARRRLDAAVVCAGADQGRAFSLEDTAAAGALVEGALRADPALHLADSAWAALHLWRFYRGDAARAFRHASHGRALRELGFVRDLAYAAQVDISRTVPTLYDEDGVATLRAGAKARTRGWRR